ncbi:MAG: hypothetical protein HGA19_15470 [Oscillochloris sp.]|nr:hypothetical protein [Oscillochloris sp.]
MHKVLPLLLIFIALAGCVAPVASVPTAIPTTAVIGPPAPSSTPQPDNPLPAPLYVLDNGQIARIERDGKSRTLITDDKNNSEGVEPISTFVMSPAGELAFIVGNTQADQLVLMGSGGENRHIIYEAEGHELSDLAWSPDGTNIYLRLLNNREPPDTPSGIYRITAEGGTLELLRADDTVDDIVNPSPTISGYRPFSTSPDGAHLLVEVFSLYYDGCNLGVMPTDGGEVVHLTIPADVKTYCGEAAWSPDGTAVYFLAGADTGPTIWRGDVSSGATLALTNADVLSRAPYTLADGTLRFILASRDTSSAAVVRFTLATLAAPGAAPTNISPAFADQPGLVLWEGSGSGAAIASVSAEQEVELQWVPANGTPIPLPATRQGINTMAWGLK